jgi:Dolichyl-phosphate-mannose-protein mannosyltransferase
VGIALVGLLVASFALRTWDASQGLHAGYHFDERFTLRNVSAILKHGDYKPRHAPYLSLSYLPQTAVLGACQALHRATRYPPFSIYGDTQDGYSPTAYWLARMVNVVYGCLSLWLLYLVGRRLYSPEVGLLAAAVMAAFPRHLLSSAELRPDILVVLLVVLTFSWTLTAAFRPALSRFLRVGLGVGLALSTMYTGIASAIPLTASVIRNGWHDRGQRRQWLWLVLAGVASILTFLALNPFPDVAFPMLLHGYAAQEVVEKSDHWVVFQRQVEFLVWNHGPVVSVFVLLGIVGLLWRIFRPAPEDGEERRLGSTMVLAALLGYSVLHSLGTPLFRGQSYLPVVPFSSLVAGWAVVEAWRLLSRRLGWLARQPVAAVLGMGVCAVLVVQQASVVYYRVVPRSFAAANRSLVAGLEPPGLRHVIYEAGLGAFQSGDKPRRLLVSRVDRLSGQDPSRLDRTDVEIFPGSRLQGPEAPFYRGRLARVPKAQVEVVGSHFLDSRGEPVEVVHHLWDLESVVALKLRRPEGRLPVMVGRLPDLYYQPGDILSIVVRVPKEAANEDIRSVRLEPGDRTIPIFDTGRHRNRLFRTSPRFQLSGQEIRVRIPAPPGNPPASFRIEVNRWRPGAALVPSSGEGRPTSSPPPHTPAPAAPPPAAG